MVNSEFHYCPFFLELFDYIEKQYIFFIGSFFPLSLLAFSLVFGGGFAAAEN